MELEHEAAAASELIARTPDWKVLFVCIILSVKRISSSNSHFYFVRAALGEPEIALDALGDPDRPRKRIDL